MKTWIEARKRPTTLKHEQEEMPMNAVREISVRPATINMFSSTTHTNQIRKKVAAYARVSTDNDEQLSSFDAQMDYYTRQIEENSSWEFVKIYTDEGISGTSTKNRDGFNRMIADAMVGKIDLIITKSVSRFARNTVDTLTTVRQLKDKGVEVYFEKENIYTMDSKGELFITIMSSLAQEESRSISENVTWGKRKSFADGKVSLPYGRFLGYEKGEDGLPKIVEKEAKVIRSIYKLFLEGMIPAAIAHHLTNKGISTPAGGNKWFPSTIKSILKNEKYKGDARLQKTFTIDFLTKKQKKNEGEVTQYYVENSHPAIISPEVFDLVQHELMKQKSGKGRKTCVSCFSGKIVCGDCGSHYGSKLWHSTSKYRRTVWQCNHKFKNENKCKTPHLYEDKIKEAFLGVFNSIIENKDEILRGYKDIIEKLVDTSALDNKNEKSKFELEEVFGLLNKCVKENAHTTIDQAEYQQKYKDLIERYENTKNIIDEIEEKISEQKIKCKRIGEFIKILDQRDGLLSEFDEDLWNTMIEKVTVRTKNELVFGFKDGREIEWKL